MSQLFNLDALSSEELHALNVIAREAEKRRDELTSGAHPIDCKLSIKGTLRVADGVPTVQKFKPKLDDAIAVLLGMMPRAMRDKVSQLTVEQCERLAADFAKPARELIDQWTTTESTVRRGAVTAELEIVRPAARPAVGVADAASIGTTPPKRKRVEPAVGKSSPRGTYAARSVAAKGKN